MRKKVIAGNWKMNKTPEEAKKFIPPIWFGNDITNDKRFKNKNLARSFTSLNELLDKNTKKKTLE